MKPLEPEDWPKSAASIAEAARITGLTRKSLHAWRKEGCEAFKPNGRVDLHELRAWILENDKGGGQETPDIQAARLRLLNAQASKVERENRRAEGQTVSKPEVVMALGQIMASMFAQLERAQQELPAALKGQDEQSVFKKIGERIDEIKSELSLKFEAMEKGA